MDCVKNTFLRIPSRTYPGRIIGFLIRWLLTSQNCWRYCKPPYHGISTSSEYGKQCPPEYPSPTPETGTVENLQQVLSQNQELMLLISTNSGKSGSKNTNRPPNTSTRPPQGQPHHPMPAYFDKYFWTHGHGSHKGGNYNSKAPGHKDKAITENKTDGRN